VSSGGGWSWWSGPGLGKAWALTRGLHVLKQRTFPVLSFGFVLIVGYLWLRGVLGGHWFVGPMMNIAFYFIGLPTLFLFVYNRGCLLVEDEDEDEEHHES